MSAGPSLVESQDPRERFPNLHSHSRSKRVRAVRTNLIRQRTTAKQPTKALLVAECNLKSATLLLLL
jgi:hypothetical protein